MPTGYTAAIHGGKDVDFADFALECARGTGILVGLRDYPLDLSSVVEVRPRPFFDTELAEAQARLREIEGWSEEQADKRAQEAYDRTLSGYKEALASKAALRARYESMLAKAEAWVPPTPDHQGLKDFMIAQLNDSIQQDCDITGWAAPERPTATVYKEQQLAFARRRVEGCANDLRDETERAQRQTAWVRTLRESLMASPSASTT